jgi:HSP20 family protein
VSETDEEICITAELPGVEEKDIDISVSANRITIKGDKKSETEEKKEQVGRQFLRLERSSGSFKRYMNLPFDIDPDTVEAEFKRGVLTVRIPKPPEAIEKTKKIEIRKPS